MNAIVICNQSPTLSCHPFKWKKTNLIIFLDKNLGRAIKTHCDNAKFDSFLDLKKQHDVLPLKMFLD